jgi:hypothetical protein
VVASGTLYAGLFLILLGAVSLIKPLRFLGIRTRPRGALMVGAGVFLCVAGMALPSREVHGEAPATLLDGFMPVYEFREAHSIRVRAPRENVYRAIKSVTADEIALFRTLTWLRRLGRPGPESILNAPEHLPILQVATRTGFLLLADEQDREILIGAAVAVPPGWRPKKRPTPEEFKAVREPGFALAAMNFRLEDVGGGACLVTTETRVHATDASTRRKFSRYWRVIYPGSWLIRWSWLRAVRTRAERPEPHGGTDAWIGLRTPPRAADTWRP